MHMRVINAAASICASSDITIEVVDVLEYKMGLCSTQMYWCFIRAGEGLDRNGKLL
jgi:hypothetical protein